MSWLWTFGSVPELKPVEVLQVSKNITALPVMERRAATAPRIVDVRTAPEFRAGHIAGAVNASFLPPWSFSNRIQPLLADTKPDTPMVVICLSAHRSIGALKWLNQQGYTHVHQLQGGMQQWRKEGLPEVKDQRGGSSGQDQGPAPPGTAQQ